MRFTILCLLIAVFAHSATAQSDSAREKVQLRLGVFHNTGLNYYGRTDSLRSSGSFPLAEIWFGDNFYINAAPVFVSNAMSSFDYAGTVATAGYRFSGEKLAGNFNLVKPFYEAGTGLVQSALKAQFGATITSLNKVMNITAGGDVKFSDNVDFGATAGIDHIFRKQFTDNSVLVFDPSAYVNAGTQQFTKTYYKRSSFLFFPGVEQTVTERVKKFNILSYELSMPVIYAKGKFQAIAIPAYVIPQNLITVEGRPDLSERGREMFYATVGVKLSL
ncbi:MAG TPA: hypothetical protein VEB63_04465 [Chitinophagaceae bacterium]|nr:hypothetical protein [Chitinophagaceae bacterium]